MSASPWINPNIQPLDNNGLILPGGKLYTYQAGGTTPQATYTDAGGGTSNANPVVLDGNGRANVWLAAASYRFDLYTSANVLVWSVDNVTPSALNAVTQAAANTVYAGPTSGGNAIPAFRALVAADVSGLVSGFALPTLSNLAAVSINTSLLAQTGVDLGSAAAAFRNLYLWGSGTFATTSIEITGTPTGTRVWTIPDSTDTFVGVAAVQTLTNKTLTTPTIGSFTNATHNHTNAAGGGLLAPLTHPSNLITADGALSPHTGAAYWITKAGVAAMTLAAPTATTDDNVQIEISSTTANAHTLTATSLLYDGNTGVPYTTATFAAFAGARIVLRAYQAKWYVLTLQNVTLT